MAIQTERDVDDVVSEINVTPLVDVMLVMLVVFIVTAPLLTNAVKVHLPQTSTNAPLEPKEAITLSLDARGKIYVDRVETPLRGLEEELRRRRTAQPGLVVNLSADETASYGLVAKVMSATDRAGITKLSVLTIGE
jgi:biopolymer transport protein ExbD